MSGYLYLTVSAADIGRACAIDGQMLAEILNDLANRRSDESVGPECRWMTAFRNGLDDDAEALLADLASMVAAT